MVTVGWTCVQLASIVLLFEYQSVSVAADDSSPLCGIINSTAVFKVVSDITTSTLGINPTEATLTKPASATSDPISDTTAESSGNGDMPPIPNFPTNPFGADWSAFQKSWMEYQTKLNEYIKDTFKQFSFLNNGDAPSGVVGRKRRSSGNDGVSMDDDEKVYGGQINLGRQINSNCLSIPVQIKSVIITTKNVDRMNIITNTAEEFIMKREDQADGSTVWTSQEPHTGSLLTVGMYKTVPNALGFVNVFIDFCATQTECSS